MNKSKSIYLVILLSLSLSTLALPQSNTKANKTVKVITNLMKECVNHNWMLYDIRFNEKPFMNYNVIFNENASGKIDPSVIGKRDQYFKGEFGLDPRSELSKKLIDPLDNEFIRMSGENPEPRDSMNAISNLERQIGVIYVYVFLNKKEIEGKQIKDEKIPGASLITKINTAYKDSCDWDSYFLAFGNWKNAETKKNEYYYKFKKEINNSSIENFVVVLTGVKNRVQELLTGVDWNRLNQLLIN